MPRMRYPLPQPDQRTVMLGEACRAYCSGMGMRRSPGWISRREDRGVGPLAVPGVDGLLVCGVLASSDLGGSPAVGGVTLLGAQLREHLGGCLASGRALLGEPFGAVLVAVSAAAIGQRSAAVPARVRQRDELGARAAAMAIRRTLIPGPFPVAPRDRRAQRQTRLRVLRERVRDPFHRDRSAPARRGRCRRARPRGAG